MEVTAQMVLVWTIGVILVAVGGALLGRGEHFGSFLIMAGLLLQFILLY